MFSNLKDQPFLLSIFVNACCPKILIFFYNVTRDFHMYDK